METRSLPVLAWAFAGLLLLTAVVGMAGLAILERIRAGEAELRTRHLDRTALLERIRSGILLSGALARDYYMEPNGPGASELLERLRRLATDSRTAIDQYANVEGVSDRYVVDLRGSLNAYWKVLELMTEIAQRTRSTGVDAYFRSQIGVRREEMLKVAGEIGKAIERERAERETEIAGMYAEFRRVLIAGLVLVMIAGSLIAIAAGRRLLGLERAARTLSAQLVQTQEQERRSIARELHDEIGQGLTGLLLDVGAATSATEAGPLRSRLQAISASGERLIEEVRRISLSLRPSMLDDLGLVPALEWQAREVGNRCGLSIEVLAEDSAGELPEEQRICVYRVVQEALQNCVRHAGARQVQVALERTPEGVSLVVKDDGKGFRAARTRGLGLLGMEERVRQLGGRLRVLSEPGRGTTLTAQIPT